MHNHPIRLNSILDNDFYKITMQQGVFQLFPWAKARYKFINRGKHYFPDGFASALKISIEAMAQVKLTKAEKQFLKETCPYLTPVYLDFLEGFTFNPDEVHIHQNGGDLQVEIEGLWYRTILWEVPIMSLISELFYELNNYIRWSDLKVQEITRLKIEHYKKLSVTVAEFGTRRRHSYKVHDMVMQSLIEHGLGSFIGSSNVHFAMKYKTKPIGTHAHEWFMFHAAKYGYKLANATSLDDWVKVYRGDLGIALSDTYTTKIFLNQFDKMHSKLFDGVRHDSGNPIQFIDQIVNHYEKMGIDPLSKTIVFSDGLNSEKVEEIAKYGQGKIGMSFGIGTNLTNDVGLEPMNIVIKMVQAKPENEDWIDVVKLSDEPNKHTGNEHFIRLSKEILGIQF